MADTIRIGLSVKYTHVINGKSFENFEFETIFVNLYSSFSDP